MQLTKEGLWDLVQKVKTESPLVHNITNYVVMNNTANALLAIGASPVMAHAIDEVADMVAIAGALVINIGTLEADWNKSMLKAAETAAKLGKPIVIDPVGAGATAFRNQHLQDLLTVTAPTVLRGNASEIMAVFGHTQSTKGVDSTASSDSAIEAAKGLNQDLGSVICVSGATDYILTNGKIAKVHNGHPMMTKVTGMGCTCTAVIGACIAAHPNAFEATTAAMTLMGVAGEIAVQKSNGPGTLQLHLLDKLYNVTEAEFMEYLRFEVVVA